MNNNLKSADPATAVSNDDFVGFTATATNPVTLNLTGFSISTAIAHLTTDKLMDMFNILVQTGGGTTWNAANALISSNQTLVSPHDDIRQDNFVDLSGNAAFQGIDSVEIRIYGRGGSGTQNNSRTKFDQIFLEGIVVPEHTAIVLLEGFLGAICSIHRYRRARVLKSGVESGQCA
ncbi:MAG: hypothetical protein P1U68_05190 [Verrucomicrobiales bacterium]|nr:hypothetical protein [Verrucomicrobiales bacterium]